jgi:hypothetical protein
VRRIPDHTCVRTSNIQFASSWLVISKSLGATVLNAAPFATHCSAKLALSLQNDSRHFQNRINVAIVVYKSWRPDPSRSASARV